MTRGIVLAACAVVALASAAGELEVAKNALRDGLWDVARTHAQRATGNEAKEIVLEAYTKEGRWEDVLKSLASWNEPKGESFDYFRALALLESGRAQDALKVLDVYIQPVAEKVGVAAGEGGKSNDKAVARGKVKPVKKSQYAPMFAVLRARALLASGDAAAAVAAAKESGMVKGDASAKTSAAEIFAAGGDIEGAKALWREVAAETNAPSAVLASAATGLGDSGLMRRAADAAPDAVSRRALSLRLGLMLLDTEEGFDEGTGLVRRVVKDFPGAPGAKDAFLVMADRLLERRRNADAVEAYKDAVNAWPEAAREFSVHEGLGWALLRLSRYEESAEAFARAEEFATNDVDRATAIMEQGDVFSESSRGDEALAKYRLVLEKYPTTPAGEKLKTVVELREQEARGRELYRDFRFKEAQAVFAELGRRDPSRKPRMDYLEMLCLYGQVNDAEAARKAKDLAAGCPDPAIRAEAALWLAKFFYNARQWEDAVGLFTQYATNMAPASAQAPSALLWASRAAFVGNEFKTAVDLVTRLVRDYPESPEKAAGLLVQGEALVELSRFDEAILVLDGAASDPKASVDDRRSAKTLKADALFVMGADNPARYREALNVYNSIKMGESLDDAERLSISFKVARTLDRLGRVDEAIDQYYVEVVCAYLELRRKGKNPGDEARATFAKAAFRLADEFESRGEDRKAESVLSLVTAADAGAAAKEARRRMARLQGKGRFK